MTTEIIKAREHTGYVSICKYEKYVPPMYY